MSPTLQRIVQLADTAPSLNREVQKLFGPNGGRVPQARENAYAANTLLVAHQKIRALL